MTIVAKSAAPALPSSKLQTQTNTMADETSVAPPVEHADADAAADDADAEVSFLYSAFNNDN